LIALWVPQPDPLVAKADSQKLQAIAPRSARTMFDAFSQRRQRLDRLSHWWRLFCNRHGCRSRWQPTDLLPHVGTRKPHRKQLLDLSSSLPETSIHQLGRIVRR